MLLKYDFHIHSCLSPCADIDMTPNNIVRMAKLTGYDVIALCDHNSAKNTPAFLASCRENDIIGIPAIELCTREEVHVLCLFEDLYAALEFSDYIYNRLPDIKNKSEFFGRQYIMDDNDNIAGEEEKLLIQASDIGIYEVNKLVDELHGTAIPAHINKPSFSLLSNLGYYDRSLDFCAVELLNDTDIEKIKKENPHMNGLSYIVNSDAHCLTSMLDAKRMIDSKSLKLTDILSAIKFEDELQNRKVVISQRNIWGEK